MTDQNSMLFKGKASKRLHVMAKPIGAACNIDCQYCYYLSNLAARAIIVVNFFARENPR